MSGKVGYIVGFIVAAVVAFYLVQSAISPQEDWDAALVQASAEINAGLPTMIDSETRLERTTPGPNSLTYVYTLINVRKEDVNIKEFQNLVTPRVKNSVCSAPEMQGYRDHGTEVHYNYRDKNDVFIVNIPVYTTTCP